MIYIILIAAIILLSAWAIAATFFMIRFARIIMILEDDFGEAIDGLKETESSLEKILRMQLFFEKHELVLCIKAPSLNYGHKRQVNFITWCNSGI
jgi:hypothetical protein